jgi:hypothetical protein
MTRMLKALGLAMASVAALVTVMAPASQAATGALTTNVFPSIVTGGQLGGVTFDIGEGPLKTIACGTSDLTSTLPGPTDPVTLVPTYGAEPGAMPVTITTNGCDYNVGVSKPGTTQEPGPASTGKMEAWLTSAPRARWRRASTTTLPVTRATWWRRSGPNSQRKEQLGRDSSAAA